MHVAYNERITRKRFFRVQVQLNLRAPIAAAFYPIAAAGAKARPTYARGTSEPRAPLLREENGNAIKKFHTQTGFILTRVK